MVGDLYRFVDSCADRVNHADQSNPGIASIVFQASQRAISQAEHAQTAGGPLIDLGEDVLALIR